MVDPQTVEQLIFSATDAELAGAIRHFVYGLNKAVEGAAQRGLHVRYDIKPGVKTDGLTNPRIIVSVMMEVC